MSNRKILLTGGLGFIGQNLCKALIQKGGYEITVLDNLSPQVHNIQAKDVTLKWYQERGINVLVGDIQDTALVSKAVVGQEIIVHLAAETGTGQSMYAIKNYTDVNIGGTSVLLEAIANTTHKTIKKLIVASSRAVYGEGKYVCEAHGMQYPNTRYEEDLIMGIFEPLCSECKTVLNEVPTSEDARINPLSIYGLTKYAQENMCMVVGRALGISTLGLRFQNVYGPGQSLHNPYTGILSIFSTRILNGKDINIFEDGKESRDFVYIDDVVNSLCLSIENSTIFNDVFNIGSGVATSVEDITKLLIKNFDKSIKYEVSGNFRVGDIRHNMADLTKARTSLGFLPQITIEEGISRFVNWVKTQEISTDLYDKSLAELREKGLFK